jgi:hypothetical protein
MGPRRRRQRPIGGLRPFWTSVLLTGLVEGGGSLVLHHLVHAAKPKSAKLLKERVVLTLQVQCLEYRQLRITIISRSETLLQAIVCDACGFRQIDAYKEFARGVFSPSPRTDE